MADQKEKRQRLALAICDFLSSSIKNGIIKEDDAEGIEVAIQCIGEAFGVDPEQPGSLSIKPATLPTIFDVFLQTQKKVAGKSEPSKAEEKEAQKAKAEALKTQGNKLMAEKKYDEAIQKYTEAVELDPSNAVFYANRAAAYSQKGDHENAVEDAKLSVEADPDYSKGYSRMGHAYFCLGKFAEAVDSYDRGLRLDPGNASMKQSQAAAQQKLNETTGGVSRSGGSEDAAGAGGLPGMGGPGGMDFASMLSNPNFMSMASQMMSNPAVSQMLNNPAVAQMAQNLMQDPSALQNLMSNPDIAKMAAGLSDKKQSGDRENMRAFVSNIDTPLGHNLSRVLSLTVVGSRRDAEPEEEEGSTAEEGEKVPTKNSGDGTRDTYKISGTLSRPKIREEDDGAAGQGTIQPSLPGNFVETGDKKKDSARKEQIERFAVAGRAGKWVSDIVNNDDREELRKSLLAADVIIYDLVQSLDEATWAIDMLSEISDSFVDRPKVFIGVSSVMTWARTKVDQDDPEAFLAEDEYRRRKPHPNFKTHITVEKNIIKAGKKSALQTYVVAAGLIYHSGDSIFHYLFKSAWHNEEELTCFGDGSNVLPTIHLDDLCNILVEVAETTPEAKYFLAIDESKNTLYEITKAISEGLSTGKVKKAPKELALVNKGLPQSDYDMLLVNLRLEPGHVKDMTFEWKYESGIVENINQLVQEYKDARGLHPLKVIVHGPPASGKTHISRQMATHYEIHYINVEIVIKEAVSRLELRIAEAAASEDSEEDVDGLKDFLEEVREACRANNGKYADHHVISFVKERLKSMPSRNQGYVLDGFPTKIEEASNLFKAANEDEGKEERGLQSTDDVIIPDFIISLEASDDFIKERIMNIPEASLELKNTEEVLVRRLEEFRSLNTEENTVLNFFDELEIHPFVIPIESKTAEFIIETVLAHLGTPRNYGPSAEQIAEKRRAEEEKKAKEAAAAEDERIKREKEESERQSKAVAEWNARMEDIRKQEQDVLEAQSVPLRNYLMKYVMPTLTSGLIEVCKARPEDPIDYLAEYLFKHNSIPSQ
ncbi:Adenylate kinase 7 [Phlyctochytrium planicorne]|nr:Adenylate kinase 7 [Phlyctochytrium planicorne]